MIIKILCTFLLIWQILFNRGTIATGFIRETFFNYLVLTAVPVLAIIAIWLR